MSDYHTSVLLKEAVDALQVTKGGKYIDATLGGGGHSFAILERGGEVLSIDVDEDAIRFVSERLKIQDLRFKVDKDLFLERGNFKDLEKIARIHAFENVSGILFDLGVSSHQFDAGERGFSFRTEAPLDMRMDKNLTVTAGDLVNGLTKEELTALFEKYGEEPFAKRIAGEIVKERKTRTIETTTQLANLVKWAYPRTTHPFLPSTGGETKRIHPATKVFQALRIAVNDELHNLRQGLLQAERLLAPKGRLVVISFHSLEDRIVKNMFAEFAQQQKGGVVTDKPIVPAYEEIQTNSRSRSAKLRVFEKA